jgi:pyruvate dehydrogenase E2 component (dihydrolipoamide acetyltransferase)
MAEVVRMPKMSDTMTEGVVAKWHKKIGDKVKTGDLVAEIETDKATMEFESYQEGTLLYIGVEGEDYKSLLEAESKTVAAPVSAPAPAPASAPVAAPTPAPAKPAPVTASVAATPTSEALSSADDGRVKASPLARKLAGEKGIDLTKVMGSGDSGRVVKRDVEWFRPGSFVTSQAVMAGAVTKESFEEVAVSQMRKTIAKRLAESKFSAPHFYLTMEISMDRCVDARESINAATGAKISYNDFVVKAAAAALRQHPKINSSWLGDRIRTNHHINIGVAVAVDEGLLVPVVRFADSKTLSQINAEVKEYSRKAKDKKLQPSDWEGNTFTISNLGMFGIDEFTAIINPPDACILAVGGMKETPVVINGRVRVSNVMKVTLSCDHRIVDGVTGAKFLQTLKGFLENPVLLLGQASI